MITSTRSTNASSVENSESGMNTPSMNDAALGDPRMFDWPRIVGRSNRRPKSFSKFRPGARFDKSLTSRIPRRLRSAALKAVTLIGTSCNRSVTLRAVITISSRPPFGFVVGVASGTTGWAIAGDATAMALNDVATSRAFMCVIIGLPPCRHRLVCLTIQVSKK
ncbi:MAG: hypothetical protein ABIR77_08005 [Sphingomicrobium sp.]